MKKKILAGLATGLFMFGLAGVASATLIGNDMLVARQYTDSGGLYTVESWNVTISDSLELDNVYSGFFDIDISDTSIIISFNEGLAANPIYPFNGLTFTDSNGTIGAFTYLALDSTDISGFSESLLSFQDDKLWVDLGGIRDVSGNFIKLNIGTAIAPVPEPSTMLLLGTGLTGIIGSRLKRKKKA